MFYEIFINLCKENNVSPTTLLTDYLHMSSGNMTKWKSGNTPKADTIKKIADYFHVSADYLLGNEQKNKPSDKTESLSQDDIKFLDRLKQLAPGDRDFLSAQIDLLIARQQEKK